jgi:hypothetical protein
VIGRPHLAFQDFDLYLDAGLTNPSADGPYGMICRFRNEKNYYFFQIGPGASAAIGKMVDGVESILASKDTVKDMQPSPAVNHLQAECNKDQLKFLINGVLVANVQDSDLTLGDMGVFVVGPEAGKVEALFDNIFVFLPTP